MFRRLLLATALIVPLTLAAQAADLLQVYEDAVLQDAELAIEKARLQQARAQIRQADSAILPSLKASGDWQRRDPEGQSSETNLALTLEARQVLFSGEAWYGRTSAQKHFAAAEARYRDTEQQLLLRVSEAYFGVLRAEDNLRTLLAEERALGRQLDQVKEQHQVGLIAMTDVLEAQAAYDSVRAARIGAEGALMIRYEDLEQITDQRYEQVAILQDELPVSGPAPNDRQAWVNLALANSLALEQARAQLGAAEELLKSRRAGHWPRVSAYGSYTNNSDTSPNRADAVSVLGLRAEVELYGGGRTSAQIRESSHQLEEARFSSELARRQILQQTRSLFTLVNTDVLTVQARQQAIHSALSALEATRSGYEVGTRNLVDVLNAERALWSAKRDHDAARYDYVVNQLRLKRVAGTLTEQHLRELNHWLQAAASHAGKQ